MLTNCHKMKSAMRWSQWSDFADELSSKPGVTCDGGGTNGGCMW